MSEQINSVDIDLVEWLSDQIGSVALDWAEEKYALKFVPGGATLFYDVEAVAHESVSRLSGTDLLGASAEGAIAIVESETLADEDGIAEKVWLLSRDFQNAVATHPKHLRIARRFNAH